MVKLNEVLAEAKAVALAESLRLLEVDHTDYAIKLRLIHPFLDARQHIPADSTKSITEFAKESLGSLIDSGLL